MANRAKSLHDRDTGVRGVTSLDRSTQRQSTGGLHIAPLVFLIFTRMDPRKAFDPPKDWNTATDVRFKSSGAEAEHHAKFVSTSAASAYPLQPIKIKRHPAGFVVPPQPAKASKPPPGPRWVHEIKHDGDRIIVRRDGPIVRLYGRNA